MVALPLLLAWATRWGALNPPERSSEALAAALEQASGAAVAADELHWQPSAGLLADALWGRSLVFLGRPEGHAGNDVWQAWVRLTPTGQPISIGGPSNWTRTALADERGLNVVGSHIAYAAVHQGRLQGVSLVPFYSRDPWWVWSSSWLTRFATHVHIPHTEQLSLFLDEAALRIELPGVSRRLAIPLASAAVPAQGLAWPLEGAQGSVEVWTVPHTEPPRNPWMARLAALTRPEHGGAQLEAGQRAHAQTASPERALVNQLHHSPPTSPLWPPPNLQPLLPGGLAGEGIWEAPEGVAESTIRQTFIRSDADQPESRVLLVAMDLTRLRLAMEAGWLVPRSQTGLPGRGRPPAPVRERVVAMFNGAGSDERLGMRVNGRLLAPARSGAPTIAVHEDARVGIGVWSPQDEAPPAVWSSFRQTEVMLLDGTQGPRSLGSNGGEMRERSALCLAHGALVYAWGTQLTEQAMVRALRAAGCRDAAQLDQGPGHGTFLMTEFAPQRTRVEPLLGARRPESALSSTGAERDFFYLVRRQPERQHELVDWGGLKWLASPGPQPAPAELPAVYAAELLRGGLRIALLGLDPLRVRYDVSAGLGEPVIAGRAAPRRRLSVDEDVLLTVELGHTTRALRYGLWVDRRRAIPLRSDFASLWTDEQGRLFVAGPATSAPPSAQGVIQLPLLVNNGELTERARSPGARRERGALCVRATGHVVIASATHDSSGPLALALRELGCERVVELDRGSKHALRLVRHAPAQARGEATRLYVIGRASPTTTFTLSDGAAR